jgi:Double zinc ribbon/Phospholipase_D-nuclease N-terminal
MTEGFDIRREIAIIPKWAFVVAALLFVVAAACFLLIWPHAKPEEAPPIPLLILMGVIVPAIFSFLILMIGYVNRDAGRRGMSRTLWTLVVIFVPNAIGFILYFLLRHPIRTLCPKCSTAVDPRTNYCPACGYGLSPTCPSCKAAIRPGDRFCVNCGGQLNVSL